jgi:predicted AAA+ superfamily ATPase
MYNRLIKLEKDPEDSFFVWGPRQSGKSTWLKKFYPDAIWIDLLNSEQFIKYKSEPHRLREEL